MDPFRKPSIDNVPIEKVHLPQRSLRRPAPPEELDALAASILEFGVIEPLIVRKIAKGFEVVAGVRRLLACRKAEIAEVPVIVRDMTEEEGVILNLVENADRAGFTPVEQAEILKNGERLAPATSRERLARLLRLNAADAALAERITSMSTILREAIAMRIITPEMAVELNRIPETRGLLDAIGRIHKESLSLTEVKLLVDQSAHLPPPETVTVRRAKPVPLLARVRLLLRKLARQGKLDFDLLKGVTTDLMKGLAEESPYPFLDLTYRESCRTFLPRHSLNVAKLALYLGKHYGYGDTDLELLASAALLSDVGMAQIPSAITQKPGALTPREWGEIKRHAERGTLILKKEAVLWEAIARTAFEHHEKIDGSGYPRGLKGEEIHTFARIINIVDTFEAMISPRPHRLPLMAHDAMRHLVRESESGTVDRGAMRIFVRCMSMYPIGSYVRVSTGETGMVIKPNGDDVDRPVVKLFINAQRNVMKTPAVVDLAAADHRALTIEPVPPPEQAVALKKRPR